MAILNSDPTQPGVRLVWDPTTRTFNSVHTGVYGSDGKSVPAGGPGLWRCPLNADGRYLRLALPGHPRHRADVLAWCRAAGTRA